MSTDIISCYQTLKNYNNLLLSVKNVNDIHNIKNNVIMYCNTSYILNSELDDNEYVIIDYYENKKKEYELIESELIKLRDIMYDLQIINKSNSKDINTIDSYISHIRNQISHAELEIVCINNKIEIPSVYKYALILVSALLIIIKNK